MKVLLEEKEKIKRLFSYLFGVIPQRSPISILSCILLRAETEFEAFATDLDVEMSVKMKGEIKEKGDICIEGENIRKVIEKAEYNKLKIDTSEDILTIGTENGNFRWKTQPISEYPDRSKVEEKTGCVIELKELADAILKTDFSVSTERTRYALNGISVKLKGGVLEMASTDGRRLSIIKKRVERSKEDIEGIIIQIKAIKILHQICSKEKDETIRLFFSNTYTGAETETTRMVSRNIEGQFPDYESVIPNDCDKKFTANRTALYQAIVEGSLASERDSEAVTFDIDKNRAIISSHSVRGNEAVREIEGEYIGEKFKISFNPQYLLQPISVLNTETVTLAFKEKDSAALLYSLDEPDYKYVVMPLTMD